MSLLEAAQDITADLIPVMFTRGRTPLTDEQGHALVIESPDQAETVLSNARDGAMGLSLAICLYPRSDLVCVDIDRDNPSTRSWLSRYGVSSRDPVWVCRTPRGGYHVFYRWPGGHPPAKRMVRVDDVDVDLLCNGTSIVPPSRGYAWLPGHGFDDIATLDLAPCPDALTQRWRDATEPQDARQTWLARTLSTTIADGYRNDTLTSIAGYLHRKFPGSEAEMLLRMINQQCCQPPLPEHEVTTIWRSISRKDGHRGLGLDLSVREVL